MKDEGGDAAVAHFRFHEDCRHPRRVLLSMDAVVFDNATTADRGAVGESDDSERDLIFLGMGPQPAEHDFGGVMGPAPPLLVDPGAYRIEMLGTLGKLFNLEAHKWGSGRQVQ